MNFVRAETLVQEITADGKIREIVTSRVKSEAEQEAERKEQILRNLPEFKRNRGEGKSAAEQIAERAAQEAEEEASKPKEYNVHTIDEAEFEHYQELEDAEREKTLKRLAADKEATEAFASERKRLRQEAASQSAPHLVANLQRQTQERAAGRSKAAPTAASRLKGIVTVRARNAASSEAQSPTADGAPSPTAAKAATGGLGGGLVGYDSDSDS